MPQQQLPFIPTQPYPPQQYPMQEQQQQPAAPPPRRIHKRGAGEIAGNGGGGGEAAVNRNTVPASDGDMADDSDVRGMSKDQLAAALLNSRSQMKEIKTLNGALVKTTEQAAQAQADMAKGCERVLTQIRGMVSEDTFSRITAGDLALQSTLAGLYQIADKSGMVGESDVVVAIRKLGVEPTLRKRVETNASKEDRQTQNARSEEALLASEFKAAASFCDENRYGLYPLGGPASHLFGVPCIVMHQDRLLARQFASQHQQHGALVMRANTYHANDERTQWWGRNAGQGF
jgi:hypothetical protein